MSRRACVIDNTTGEVVNVIVYDPDATWSAPDGCVLRVIAAADRVSPGDRWDGAKFVAPTIATPRPDRLKELRAKGWASLTAAERDEAQRLMFERQ